jgi:hypothetical protein
MRKCHICGLEVDDRTYICPDCGAEIVGSSGNLSLKAGDTEKKKKSGASLGTTISTGSGLTDILRSEDEDSNVLGSLPNAVSYDLSDYETDKKARFHPEKIVFRLICIAVLAFGIYMLVTKVLLKKDGPATYQEALDTYIEAINNQDLDDMVFVTPAFFSDKTAQATAKLESLKNVHIDEYEIEDSYYLTASERSKLQDDIKYATARTANMSEVINLKLKVSGSLGEYASAGAKTGEITVQIVCIRDSWYVLLEEYEDIKFE